ncbi:protein unc-79 homolog [Ostrinia nubilalis]|uniref:protein unc-79 homolog n=1 Tax=Ostrinia nubilalis TaxID=29057 RepID=UPI00308231AD
MPRRPLSTDSGCEGGDAGDCGSCGSGGSGGWWDDGSRAAHAAAARAETALCYRCAECGIAVEQYSDEELGLCVIALATFVHREPAAAAAVLPALLHAVSRVVQLGNYSWQAETNTRLPGSAVFVAHQFLRCVLHQLAPNNVFLQIFLQRTPEKQRLMFFKSIAQAFVDFNELYPCGPLQLVVEHLNSKKTLPIDQITIIAGNIAMYLECLAPEALGPPSACAPLLQQLDALLRSTALQLQQLDDVLPLLRCAIAILKLPAAAMHKSTKHMMSCPACPNNSTQEDLMKATDNALSWRSFGLTLCSTALQLQQLDDVLPLLRCAIAILKLPAAAMHKSILEPISKIISYGIQNFVVKLSVISELSVVCVRAFSRDRDKLLVCRVLVYELVQALRTKTTVPDDNLFILIQYVLQGHGCTLLLPPQLNTGDLLTAGPSGAEARELGGGAVDCMRPHLADMLELLQDPHLLNKIKRELGGGAVDCMRPHLADMLELLQDPHLLNKIKLSLADMLELLQDPHLLNKIKGSVSKSIVNRNLICLNEDTLGSIVKGGIAQYVAMELALEHGRGRQDRPAHRHMPWLTASIPGSRELCECVGRARLVSWLVMGALCNARGSLPLHQPVPQDASCHITDHIQCLSWLAMGALCNARGSLPLHQPVPQDASCHITDHIQTIMASYVEQSKPTAQRMNALFHAFILCQLWTLYLEELANSSTPSSEPHNTTVCILLEFWCKLVPSILQVTVTSKLLAETVNLHFLSILESLLECNSTVLNKLLPLWTPILHSPLFNMPRHVAQRLDVCREVKPEAVRTYSSVASSTTVACSGGVTSGPAARAHRRLHRLLAKMAQLELQPHTFYLI